MNTATATLAAPSCAGLLRRLADEQQQKEEYDARVRAEVEAALADPRPCVPHEVARERMRQYMRQREVR